MLSAAVFRVRNYGDMRDGVIPHGVTGERGQRAAIEGAEYHVAVGITSATVPIVGAGSFTKFLNAPLVAGHVCMQLTRVVLLRHGPESPCISISNERRTNGQASARSQYGRDIRGVSDTGRPPRTRDCFCLVQNSDGNGCNRHVFIEGHRIHTVIICKSDVCMHCTD